MYKWIKGIVTIAFLTYSIILTTNIHASDNVDNIDIPEGTMFLSQEELSEKAEIETKIITSLPKPEGVRSIKSIAIPKSVDNSKLKYFPKIGNQGKLGSCIDFADTYYIYTYMYARENDIDVKSLGDKAIFSPAFTYTNDIYNVGAATLDEMPYTDVYEEFVYPKEAKVWRNALSKKPLENLALDLIGNSLTVEDNKQLLKEYLSAGYIFNLSLFIGACQTETISDNTNSSIDDSEVGKLILTYKDSMIEGHRMTIVGYNDDIWLDRNKNKTIDNGEVGAFLIANSWGIAWGNYGYIWMPYDDLITAGVRGSGSISTIIPRPKDKPYQPKILAELNITTKEGVLLDITSQYETYKDVLNSGHSHSLSHGGLNGEIFGGSLIIDLTNDIQSRNIDFTKNRYEIYLRRGINYKAPITLNSFKLTDHTGYVLAECYGLPKTHTDNPRTSPIARMTYGFTDNTGPWEIKFNPNNGEETVIVNANFGDIIEKEAIPHPIKENDEFIGWRNRYGEIINLPYYISCEDSLKAVYNSDLKQGLDIEMERIEFAEKITEPVYYRQFKSKVGDIEPIINDSAAWKPLKTYSYGGKTFADISKLIDNSKSVALQFKIGGSKSGEPDSTYYFLAREKKITAKLDRNYGYSAENGYAKIAITGNVQSILYREKTSDLQYCAVNNEGYCFIPLTGYKTSYIIKSNTDNAGRDGLTLNTAFKPGSPSVSLNLTVPAKAPGIDINWTNDSLKVKQGMEISFDKETWYPILSSAPDVKAATYYQALGGISLHDELFKGKSIVYIRSAATAKKVAGNTVMLHLGYLNDVSLSSGDLISQNGKKLFGKDFVLQYLPVSNSLILNSSGNITIIGKEKWKNGAITIPKSGSVDYYIRVASTGLYRPGKAVKITVNADANWEINSGAKEIKEVKAPRVKLNLSQDAIVLKTDMEVLTSSGSWIKVSSNREDGLWYNPSINGVSFYDDVLKGANFEYGGIYCRKSAVGKNPASTAKFVGIPLTDSVTLLEDDFISVDGKKINLQSGLLEYIKASDAPTSVLENGILIITDKKAKWKTGQISVPKSDEEYYVRLAAGRLNNRGFVIKVRVCSNGDVKSV